MQTFAHGAVGREIGATAVSIGVFDGVHLGHRHVLDRLCATAASHGLSPVVVTFDPHPASVLAPERAPKLLCSLQRRIELLGDAGVAHCVVVTFDAARATQDPDAFVREVLVDELAARAVVVGENFRFGRGRAGDVAALRALAAEGGFDVESVALDASHGEAVSSTGIRRFVADGDVTAAARWLGRLHGVDGTVIKGDGRGRELGYPTANLGVDDRIAVPGVGIYAGIWTRPSGERMGAAVSIGRRPTFYDAADVLVEAHLVGFDADLYGEDGRLEFVERLRDETKFDSIDALVRQIALDVEATQAIVAAHLASDPTC